MHDSLETFSVLNDIQDIIKNNLGKTINDKRKPFFYSKAWKETKYDASNVIWRNPGLFVNDNQCLLDGFGTGKDRYIYNLEFLVLLDNHNYVQDQSIPTDEQLNDQELYYKANVYLKDVLTYLVSICGSSFRVLNDKIQISNFITQGLKYSGVLAQIKFEESCISRATWWTGTNELINEEERPVIDNNGNIIYTK